MQVKKHFVIPYKWIRGLDYERVMNYGLNRNIKFHAFWTDNENAFDENGLPRQSYMPDLNASGTLFPATGQIKKFKGIVKFKNFYLKFICKISND